MSWENVTSNVPDLPDWGTVTCVEASRHAAGTAYLVVDNHRMDDYKPHVWKTPDFGKTWTKITDGLDPGTHARVIREDPVKKGFLYLGTERGVQYSPDGGKTWHSLQLNLPTVPVHDLVVKDNDLVVGTHGRAIWILDDLTPIRERAAVGKKAVHLFLVQPATKWYTSWGGATREFLPNVSGNNPDTGAVVWFHLGPDVKTEVKIEILDAKGTVVATASGKPVAGSPPDARRGGEDDEDGSPKRKLEPKPGLNRFVWDLTHDGATVIPGAAVDSGAAGARVPVAPGTYTVRLTVGNQKPVQKVRVDADPRWLAVAPRPAIPVAAEHDWRPIPSSDPEFAELQKLLARVVPLKFEVNPAGALAAQEALALRVRDDITKLADTVARIRAVQKQITLRKDLLKDRADAKALLKQTEALAKKLDDLEGKLHNSKAKIGYDIFAARGGAMLYSQLAWLLANLTDGDGGPTKAQTELATELEAELAGLLDHFDATVKNDLVTLNAAAKKLSVPELYVPPAKKSAAKK
jgi:hypothetical protein